MDHFISMNNAGGILHTESSSSSSFLQATLVQLSLMDIFML